MRKVRRKTGGISFLTAMICIVCVVVGILCITKYANINRQKERLKAENSSLVAQSEALSDKLQQIRPFIKAVLSWTPGEPFPEGIGARIPDLELSALPAEARVPIALAIAGACAEVVAGSRAIASATVHSTIVAFAVADCN